MDQLTVEVSLTFDQWELMLRTLHEARAFDVYTKVSVAAGHAIVAAASRAVRLDPTPWVCSDPDQPRQSHPAKCDSFAPRPEFEQDRAAYEVQS